MSTEIVQDSLNPKSGVSGMTTSPPRSSYAEVSILFAAGCKARPDDAGARQCIQNSAQGAGCRSSNVLYLTGGCHFDDLSGLLQGIAGRQPGWTLLK